MEWWDLVKGAMITQISLYDNTNQLAWWQKSEHDNTNQLLRGTHYAQWNKTIKEMPHRVWQLSCGYEEYVL